MNNDCFCCDLVISPVFMQDVAGKTSTSYYFRFQWAFFLSKFASEVMNDEQYTVKV